MQPGSSSKANDGRPDWPTPDGRQDWLGLGLTERMLQDKYHIAPTKEGLLIALRHPEDGVRSFAALDLAKRGLHDALPMILEALAAETFPGTRISMATAAAQLGAAEGVSALKGMCADPAWSGILRMVVSQTMLHILSREDCRAEVLNVLRPESDTQTLLMALHQLPHFKGLTASEVRPLEMALRLLMKRDDVQIRLAVGQVLSLIGGGFGIQILRDAIPLEREEVFQKQLAADLKVLEGKPGTPAKADK
jgi:HEAT repeat protein